MSLDVRTVVTVGWRQADHSPEPQADLTQGRYT
jgi:hypothetical protein